MTGYCQMELPLHKRGAGRSPEGIKLHHVWSSKYLYSMLTVLSLRFHSTADPPDTIPSSTAYRIDPLSQLR